MQGHAPGSLLWGPPCSMPSSSWGGLGEEEEAESGGAGHVGCETVRETSRASKEDFVSGIWNSKSFRLNISVTRRQDKNLCHSTGFHLCIIPSDLKQKLLSV